MFRIPVQVSIPTVVSGRALHAAVCTVCLSVVASTFVYRSTLFEIGSGFSPSLDVKRRVRRPCLPQASLATRPFIERILLGTLGECISGCSSSGASAVLVIPWIGVRCSIGFPSQTQFHPNAGSFYFTKASFHLSRASGTPYFILPDMRSGGSQE